MKYGPQGALIGVFYGDAASESLLASSRAATPEVRLLLGVLEGAIDDLRLTYWRQTNSAAMIYAETVAWFEDRKADWPWSFEAICDVIGFDASTIRRAILSRPPGKVSHARQRHVARV